MNRNEAYSNAQLTYFALKARKLALYEVYKAGSGHPGGSMSCIDALTYLYFQEMNIDPYHPDAPDRDRFVLSKGHCSPALYAILALRGYFPEENLELFRSIKGHYSGHPDMRHVLGVDMSTGSLGQGLSAAVGMALGGKIAKSKRRIYAICGDGEMDEGQIWEAFMAAAKFELDNLCAIVDVNGLQIDGATVKVMPTEPLADKLIAFNWHVVEIDGHDFTQLGSAFNEARECKGKPTCILMHTVKGKGISYMENNYLWHGKAPNEEQYELGIEELERRLAELKGV